MSANGEMKGTFLVEKLERSQDRFVYKCQVKVTTLENDGENTMEAEIKTLKVQGYYKEDGRLRILSSRCAFSVKRWRLFLFYSLDGETQSKF